LDCETEIWNIIFFHVLFSAAPLQIVGDRSRFPGVLSARMIVTKDLTVAQCEII
jgi:hypothetical protein